MQHKLPALVIEIKNRALKKAKERNLGSRMEEHDEVSDEVRDESEMDEEDEPDAKEEVRALGNSIIDAVNSQNPKAVIEALCAAIKWHEMNPEYEEDEKGDDEESY